MHMAVEGVTEKVLAGHCAHTDAPGDLANVPLGHERQAERPVVGPKVATGQALQEVEVLPAAVL